MENLKKSITIPLDGSDNALKSIDYTSTLFDQDHNLEINTIHVISSLPFLITDETSIDKDVLASISRAEARHLIRAKRLLDKTKKKLIAKGYHEEKVKTIDMKQEPGIAHEICRWAPVKKTDALVVSRRGKTDLENFLFRRVSSNVIEYCKNSPVWINGGGLSRSGQHAYVMAPFGLQRLLWP